MDILCPGVTKSSTMAREISQELERLRPLAYHRLEWSGDLVRRFHELAQVVSASPDGRLVEQVYEWLFVPLTLWPVNMHDLLAQALDLTGSLENSVAPAIGRWPSGRSNSSGIGFYALKT